MYDAKQAIDAELAEPVASLAPVVERATALARKAKHGHAMQAIKEGFAKL